MYHIKWKFEIRARLFEILFEKLQLYGWHSQFCYFSNWSLSSFRKNIAALWFMFLNDEIELFFSIFCSFCPPYLAPDYILLTGCAILPSVLSAPDILKTSSYFNIIVRWSIWSSAQGGVLLPNPWLAFLYGVDFFKALCEIPKRN